MLADLDELLLRCRDKRARAYIGEALSCYKAGAYRASIITTWIAVMFDIIDKLRELSLASDSAAAELIEEFDAITAANAVQRAQQFERSLLSIAKDRFELISEQEYIDLERLQADRHRSAHPSQSAIGEVFSPTAELARVHIRCAVEHLLQHEPAQGKSALDGILSTVESEYFPTDEKKALTILGKSPLKRARASLVRNLTMVLLKSLLREEDRYPTSWQRRAALMCVRVLHPAQWIQITQQNLTVLVRALSTTGELLRAARVLYLHPSLADVLEEDQVVRLSAFFEKLPSDSVTELENFLRPGPLLVSVQRRVGRLTLAEVTDISDISPFGIPQEVCGRIAECYRYSSSFDEANDWGKLAASNISEFPAKHLMTLLSAALANGQIRGSFQLPQLLAAIKKTDHAKAEEVAALLGKVEAALKGSS